MRILVGGSCHEDLVMRILFGGSCFEEEDMELCKIKVRTK